MAVVVAVILSNVLVTLGASLIGGVDLADFAWVTLMNTPLFLLLIAIGWIPGRRSVLAVLLATVPLTVAYEPIIRWLFGLFR